MQAKLDRELAENAELERIEKLSKSTKGFFLVLHKMSKLLGDTVAYGQTKNIDITSLLPSPMKTRGQSYKKLLHA